jgi:hypothetical protein
MLAGSVGRERRGCRRPTTNNIGKPPSWSELMWNLRCWAVTSSHTKSASKSESKSSSKSAWNLYCVTPYCRGPKNYSRPMPSDPAWESVWACGQQPKEIRTIGLLIRSRSQNSLVDAFHSEYLLFRVGFVGIEGVSGDNELLKMRWQKIDNRRICHPNSAGASLQSHVFFPLSNARFISVEPDFPDILMLK